MTFKGKKTKRARKTSPKSQKKKKTEGNDEVPKNNPEEKKRKKCKSPKSAINNKNPLEIKNTNPTNDKLMQQVKIKIYLEHKY